MIANRWGFLALLSFIRIAMGVQFQSVGTAGPAIRADLGLDYASLGALTGSYLVLGTFFALPAGFLSARYGDRRLLLTGLALMTASGVGITLAPSFPVALAFRLLGGCGAVTLNIVGSKLVMDRFDDKSLGLAMGVLLGAWPLGIGVGSVFLPFLVDAVGWRGVMLVSAIACAGFLTLAALFIPRPGNRAAGTYVPIAFASLGWRVIVAVIVAGMVWMLANAGYIILLGQAPAYFVEQGMTLAAAGSILSLASFATIPVGPLGGWLGQRFGYPLTISCLCIAGTSIGIFLLPGSDHPALLLLITGAILGLPSGLIVALPARVLSPEQRAIGMGLFYSVFYAGLGVLSPFAGWMRDVTGIAAAPFMVAGALNLLTIGAIGAFAVLAAKANAARMA